MKLIKVDNVTVQYPIYERPTTSIRRDLIRVATGGKLYADVNKVVWVRALENIEFELATGDRLGLIGANGAGKTTLLKVLSGFLEPSKGSVQIEGTMASILTVGGGIDLERSGRENAVFMGKIMGITRQQMPEFINEISDFAELGDFFDFPVRTYSAGMLLRLAYGVATSINPEVLILDEGIMAGDEHFAQKALTRVNKIYENVKNMVLASHAKEFLRERCNKGMVLHRGKCVFFGEINEALDYYSEGTFIEP